MGKFGIAFLIVALCLMPMASVTAISGGSEQQWSKTYPRLPAMTTGGLNITHIDGGYRLVQTTDGGYAIGGNILDYFYRGPHSGGDYNYSAAILKVDEDGDEQWRKIDGNFSEPRAIFQTNNLGFSVFTRSSLVTTDAIGNVQSIRNLGIIITGAIQTGEDDYVFAGINEASGLIVKSDSDGNLIWNTTLFSFPYLPSDLSLSNIAQSSDGGYFITHWLSTFNNAIGNDFTNLVVYKVDSKGEVQFTKSYSFDAGKGQSVDPALGKQENPATLTQIAVHGTADGGCILAGGGGFNAQFTAPFIVKLDSKGDWQWNRAYATGITLQAVFSSAIQSADGGFIAVGGYNNFMPNAFTPVFKIKGNGDLEWNQTFTSSNQYAWGNQIIMASDDGYAVVGELNGDFWLSKFAPETEYSVNDPVSFLAPLIVAVAVLVIVVIVETTLLLYFRKHKRKGN